MRCSFRRATPDFVQASAIPQPRNGFDTANTAPSAWQPETARRGPVRPSWTTAPATRVAPRRRGRGLGGLWPGSGLEAPPKAFNGGAGIPAAPIVQTPARSATARGTRSTAARFRHGQPRSIGVATGYGEARARARARGRRPRRPAPPLGAGDAASGDCGRDRAWRRPQRRSTEVPASRPPQSSKLPRGARRPAGHGRPRPGFEARPPSGGEIGTAVSSPVSVPGRRGA